MAIRASMIAVSILIVIVSAIAQPVCPTTCWTCACTQGVFSCSQAGWNHCTDSNYPCSVTPYCGTATAQSLIWTDQYCNSGNCFVEDMHVVSNCNGSQFTGDVNSCCTNP